MASLAEIIAAKKAQQAAAAVPAKEELPIVEEVKEEPVKQKEHSVLEAMGLSVSTETLPEKPAETVPAKETFVERMARLRREKEAKAPAISVSSTAVASAITLLQERKETPPVELNQHQKEVLAEVEDNETAQAYTDVCLKINSLQYADDGEDLAKAMDNLTASLKKNAAACRLLKDPDIGQMVIHMRRRVGEEMVKEAEPKKKGRKPASALTKEDISTQLAIPDDF